MFTHQAVLFSSMLCIIFIKSRRKTIIDMLKDFMLWCKHKENPHFLRDLKTNLILDNYS